MSNDSIRKQIDSAKKDAEELLGSGKVSTEVAAVMKTLLLVIEIIVTVLLTKKIRKNSSNSGLPPSRNNGSNGNRNKTQGDRDKKGEQLDNTRNVQSSEIVSPEECKVCGRDLANTPVKTTEDRQKIDIIYEITHHTVTSESKECPSCSHVNKGKFPPCMAGKIQYGNGIKASIINFLMVQMISLERVQEHFKGLIGRFISQAVMLKYVAQLSDSLKNWEDEQIKRLLSSPVIHCDETSLRVNKKNHWIHSYSFGDITLKFVHPKRGIEAIEDIGIIPKYGGTLVHDCWASYLSYDNVGHALCGGHLLRELKFIEDLTKDKWATNMKKLLQEAAETISDRPEKSVLTEDEYKRFKSRYRNILTRAKKELPPFHDKSDKKDEACKDKLKVKKRGRIKHTDAQNLYLRFVKYESSILMFAKIKEVAFTNNRAERDLRISKLKQKVSGCFRTEKYAKHYCRIISYAKSMRYKGYSSFEAISFAVQGNIPR